MSASHRKFGDLLEEGIKRVHITRKKPIGYILDEFGYELRPDDSSKGRHALGHWYYKRRIPASMEDVEKLAELIVKNGDVERDWLSDFLASAGYPEPERFCNRFFLPNSDVNTVSVAPPVLESEIPAETVSAESEKEVPLVERTRSWKPFFMLGTLVVFGVVMSVFFLRSRESALPAEIVPTATYLSQSLLPTVTVASSTNVVAPTHEILIPSMTPMPDFSLFDGSCPDISPVSAFEYTGPRSFMDYLNSGGSFTALQSSFNAIVQKKTDLRDGRVYSTDLTGDGVPEIIVAAVLAKGTIWQILGCNAGHYETLVDMTDPDSRYFRFAVDLNGNKLPEIISYRQTQPESIQLYEFFVQEWNGRQIVELMDGTRFEDVGKRLPADIFDWQRQVANASVTTRDTNGNGLFEVVITGGLVTPVPTCETRFERQFTEIWAWDGKSFQLADRVYDLPIYRFQRSADGDLAFALHHFDAALKAYQDVLFDAGLFRRDQYLSHLEYCKGLGTAIDSVLLDNEQEQLMAYARWRILLINALNGTDDAVQVIYETLQEKFPEGKPGHSYAVIASAFWSEYQDSQNIQAACDSANSVVGTQNLYPVHIADNICFIP